MGKLSRYDAGELPEDKKKRRKVAPSRAPSSSTTRATTTSSNANKDKELPKKSRSVSNRVRDMKRLLAKMTDEDAKAALAQKLERLNKKQEWNERQDLMKRISEKNRKMQFLDEKKLEKRLKKANEEERELILNDIEYIHTFPKDRRYLSLFDGELDEQLTSERDALRIKAALSRSKQKEKVDSHIRDENESGDDFFQEENDGESQSEQSDSQSEESNDED